MVVLCGWFTVNVLMVASVWLFDVSSDRYRKGIIVTKPFTCWTKVTSVLDGHAKKLYHMDSVQKVEGFIAATEKPETTNRYFSTRRKESRLQTIVIF